MRRTVGEGGPDHGRDDVGHQRRVDGAARTERAELDIGAEFGDGLDGGDDVRAGLALDERLDRELEVLHGTSAYGTRRRAGTGRDVRRRGHTPITRRSSSERATQS